MLDSARLFLMATDTKRFRLTIWKPADPKRPLLIFAKNGDGTGTAHDQGDFDFHEEMYSWEPREDVWLSVSDAEDQRNLRSLLVDRFSPERPVGERGIDRLVDAMNGLRALLTDPKKTAWADSEETTEVGGESLNLRCNCIAALQNHLCWLYEVFKSIPGVSVTIR